MAKTNMKMCSTSLAIKFKLKKKTARYYYIPTRMAKIKDRTNQVLSKMWNNLDSHTLLMGIY